MRTGDQEFFNVNCKYFLFSFSPSLSPLHPFPLGSTTLSVFSCPPLSFYVHLVLSSLHLPPTRKLFSFKFILSFAFILIPHLSFPSFHIVLAFYSREISFPESIYIFTRLMKIVLFPFLFQRALIFSISLLLNLLLHVDRRQLVVQDKNRHCLDRKNAWITSLYLITGESRSIGSLCRERRAEKV